MSVCAILADPTPRLTPMGAHMLACELRDGREPITPDNCPPWLNASDWHPWPVLSVSNGELHIIAISSVRKGSLRRLIEGAATAGLSPVIVEPLGRVMPSLMRKWGWVRTVAGEGWHAREEWRPSVPALVEQSRTADQRALRALNVPEREIAALTGEAIARAEAEGEG